MIDKEEANKKIYDFLKGNIINAVILMTAAAYLFYGMTTIQQTDTSIIAVIAKAGIGVVVGFIIKQCMGENGFNYGYRSEIWNTNRSKYMETSNMALPYIERVDNFYACEEIEKKRAYRRTNLTAAQMKYDWFFDNDGNYIKHRIWSEKQANRVEKIPDDVIVLSRYQKKVLKRCLNVKIYNLNLFSEYGIEAENDTKKEKTDKTQRRMMLSKNGFFAIVSAVVGAYFVPVFAKWDWANFIQSCVQVTIWISCGCMQLYTNFNYVCVEKVAKLKRKSELIIKFSKGCQQGLYIVNPYDEMEMEARVNEQSKINSVPCIGTESSDLPDNQMQFTTDQNSITN